MNMHSLYFPQIETRLRSFVARVYAWMFLALVLSGVVAMYVASSQTLALALMQNQLVFFGLIVVELGMVFAIAGLVQRMSPLLATSIFIAYAVLNGVTLSLIFFAFTAESIATTFFITAGTFGLMSIYGYLTKRDLTSLGNLLFMALLGLILASVVNIFFANSILYWITSFVGILIFVGLTAYDTQKIKKLSATGFEGEDAEQRAAILGALALYLDFVNLFLFFLRFSGQRD